MVVGLDWVQGRQARSIEASYPTLRGSPKSLVSLSILARSGLIRPGVALPSAEFCAFADPRAQQRAAGVRGDPLLYHTTRRFALSLLQLSTGVFEDFLANTTLNIMRLHPAVSRKSAG